MIKFCILLRDAAQYLVHSNKIAIKCARFELLIIVGLVSIEVERVVACTNLSKKYGRIKK